MKMSARDITPQKVKPAGPKKPDPVEQRIAALESEVRSLRAELQTFAEAHRAVPWRFDVLRDEKGITSFTATPED